MPDKICPKCGEEYVPRAQVCADCGGALVWQSAGSAPVKSAQHRTGPRDQVILLGTHDSAGLLFERLEAVEIEAALIERTDLSWTGFVDQDPETVVEPGVFEVRVTEADSPRAEAIRDELGLSLEEKPESQEFVEGQCPACGTKLPEQVGAVCPDCGLSLEGCPEEESEKTDDENDDGAGGWLPHTRL